jgi:hypothetical protein
MYYSKNNSSTVSVPRNYAGNAFRVVDETERKYIKEDFENFKNNVTPKRITAESISKRRNNTCYPDIPS